MEPRFPSTSGRSELLPGYRYQEESRKAWAVCSEKLDALPRDHEIWRYMAVQTVNRFRLADYTRLALEEDPDDTDALLCRIALKHREFKPDLWRRLARTRRYHFTWPIYSVYWLFCQKAVDEHRALAELLLETTSMHEVIEYLRLARDGGDPWLGELGQCDDPETIQEFSELLEEALRASCPDADLRSRCGG